jgi:predicted solute-binding protein
MEKIPQQLLRQFDAYLIKKEVLEKNHNLFRKWLRYYLDFCFKYGHDPKNSESLRQFINKLREKKQSKPQQKQAYDAILSISTLCEQKSV